MEDGLKEALLSGSSLFQIGGQEGHRSEELFRYKSQGKAVIIQCYDVKAFFDKEMIEDEKRSR